MNIHHQVDFVLRIVDSLTEKGVKGGGNRFWLDGHLIKPAKVMDSFFVFSNVFNNPKNFHLFSNIDQGMLTWENPFYTPVVTSINLTVDRKITPTDEILIRALPSEYYPFVEPPTGVKGCIENAETIRLLHTYSRNRYHLKGPVTGEKYIEMAQSMDKNLEGKSFRFGDLEPIRRVFKDNNGTYVSPVFEQGLSEDCEVLEVLEVTANNKGQFFMVITDLDDEKDLSEVTLEVVQGNLSKACKVSLEKGKLVDIGSLAFENLEKGGA